MCLKTCSWTFFVASDFLLQVLCVHMKSDILCVRCLNHTWTNHTKIPLQTCWTLCIMWLDFTEITYYPATCTNASPETWGSQILRNDIQWHVHFLIFILSCSAPCFWKLAHSFKRIYWYLSKVVLTAVTFISNRITVESVCTSHLSVFSLWVGIYSNISFF